MNQDMKKIYSFMVAALALAAVSCNKEVSPVETPVGETVVFSAEMDATKTILNGNKSEWVAGDKITIHNGTKGYEFSTTEAGAKVDFTYTGDDFEGTKFMAAYPAATEADVEAKTVKANIPTYQPSVDNSYNPSAAVAVAYTENASLAFKNATSLIKFTVKGNNVKGLIFYGNNGEAVSGDVVVTLDAENAVESVVGQKTTITENEVTETKLITWAKLWANTDNWCFKEGTTYYLAVAPQNFEKGFSFELEIDGVGNKVVKTVDTEKELKPNTIYNIGELEYVAPAVPTSGWALPGGYNGWSTTDTYLVEEGDYYVAKNVSVMGGAEPGFKFQHADFGWKGVGASTALAVGEWHKLNGDKNITLASGNVAYDIYMTTDGSQFQAVTAGSPAPEAPAVVADYWALIGSFTSWASEIVLTAEGDYFVTKGVAIKATDEFKFRKNGDWNAGQNIAKGGLAAADTEYDFVDAGLSNMKVSATGTYDVYVKNDFSKVYFMTAGKTPDQAKQPDASSVYRFYIKNTLNWPNLHIYAWGTYATAGWPGEALTKTAEAPDGKGTCYYVEITKGVNIQNFVINGTGVQTKDLNKSKATQLSTGDYFYELVAADKK